MAKNSTASQETGKTKKSLRDLLTVRVIAENSILAAIYVALVLVVPYLSFGPVQCRFSEALVLLCFWRPDFTIGLSVGCLISNIVGAAIGSASPFDILIGTFATTSSCLLISYLSKRLIISIIWPIVFNAVIVGAELYFLGFAGDLSIWFSILYVGIGEAIAVAVGYVLWMSVSHMAFFEKVFQPTIHIGIKW